MGNETLTPCPFCGAGTFDIRENGRIWHAAGAEPTSVSVRHWCERIEGQPSRMIERVGRDRASAVAAWNMRAPAVSPVMQQFRDPLVSIPYGARTEPCSECHLQPGETCRICGLTLPPDPPIVADIPHTPADFTPSDLVALELPRVGNGEAGP